MTKTMGQIAYEAGSTFLASEYLEDATPWDSELPGVKGLWSSGADAILEHVAIIAEQHSGFMDGETAAAIAESIRSLKSTQEV